MGQRLVVEIRKGNSVIGTVYYHWSAYASSSLSELESLVRILENKPIEYNVLPLTDEERKLAAGTGYLTKTAVPDSNIEDPVEKIITTLAQFNGGLDRDDEEYAKEKYPGRQLPLVKNRNNGLVSIAYESMRYAEQLAEGMAYVDLDNRVVGTDCFFFFTSLEEIEDAYDFEPDVVEAKYDFSEIPFDEIEEAYEWYCSNVEDGAVIKIDDGYLMPMRG